MLKIQIRADGWQFILNEAGLPLQVATYADVQTVIRYREMESLCESTYRVINADGSVGDYYPKLRTA